MLTPRAFSPQTIEKKRVLGKMPALYSMRMGALKFTSLLKNLKQFLKKTGCPLTGKMRKSTWCLGFMCRIWRR
jgi:hypothetical protein